jgi:hypothetical protein
MRELHLSNNMVAWVDDEDYDNVIKKTWYGNKASNSTIIYARCGAIFLHRFILGLKDKHIKCDHIDGNGLNNTKSNLRICTHSENMRNRRKQEHCSIYKGVGRVQGRWRSSIKYNGKTTHIGYFNTDYQAAVAYDIIAKSLFGAFSNLNFPNNKN